jgi:transcription termination/antitermination protein NusG
VLCGKEFFVEKYLLSLLLTNLFPLLPKKKQKIRKNKILIDVIRPLFPGYIFLLGKKFDCCEGNKILHSPNVIRILGGLNNPAVLSKSEKMVVSNIIKYCFDGYSKVLKEGNKVKVVSGVLKDLEGMIVSVDRRKQTAMLKVPMMNTEVKFSLAFEYLRDTSMKNLVI